MGKMNRLSLELEEGAIGVYRIIKSHGYTGIEEGIVVVDGIIDRLFAFRTFGNALEMYDVPELDITRDRFVVYRYADGDSHNCLPVDIFVDLATLMFGDNSIEID